VAPTFKTCKCRLQMSRRNFAGPPPIAERGRRAGGSRAKSRRYARQLALAEGLLGPRRMGCSERWVGGGVSGWPGQRWLCSSGRGSLTGVPLCWCEALARRSRSASGVWSVSPGAAVWPCSACARALYATGHGGRTPLRSTRPPPASPLQNVAAGSALLGVHSQRPSTGRRRERAGARKSALGQPSRRRDTRHGPGRHRRALTTTSASLASRGRTLS
jgi:hypothetical protein